MADPQLIALHKAALAGDRIALMAEIDYLIEAGSEYGEPLLEATSGRLECSFDLSSNQIRCGIFTCGNSPHGFYTPEPGLPSIWFWAHRE